MNQTRVRLRGHHIGDFALDYFGENFHYPFLYIQVRKSSNAERQNKFIVKYGAKMLDFVETLYASLVTMPDLEIEIVEGLDSICMAGCPLLKDSCAEDPHGEDALNLKLYGLEIGRTYTAKDIVQRVEDFAAMYGKRSPREIQLAKFGMGPFG